MIELITTLIAIVDAVILIATFVVIFIKLRQLDHRIYELGDMQNALMEAFSDKYE